MLTLAKKVRLDEFIRSMIEVLHRTASKGESRSGVHHWLPSFTDDPHGGRGRRLVDALEGEGGKMP
jgi:hypothetical protein